MYFKDTAVTTRRLIVFWLCTLVYCRRETTQEWIDTKILRRKLINKIKKPVKQFMNVLVLYEIKHKLKREIQKRITRKHFIYMLDYIYFFVWSWKRKASSAENLLYQIIKWIFSCLRKPQCVERESKWVWVRV